MWDSKIRENQCIVEVGMVRERAWYVIKRLCVSKRVVRRREVIVCKGLS